MKLTHSLRCRIACQRERRKGRKKEMTRCRFCSSVKVQVGRDSVVGRASHYEPDRSGIEPHWGGENFLTRSDRLQNPNRLPYNGYLICFPVGKLPGSGVGQPPQSNTSIKERVELYLYPPSGTSWTVIGRNLVLPGYNA